MMMKFYKIIRLGLVLLLLFLEVVNPTFRLLLIPTLIALWYLSGCTRVRTQNDLVVEERVGKVASDVQAARRELGIESSDGEDEYLVPPTNKIAEEQASKDYRDMIKITRARRRRRAQRQRGKVMNRIVAKWKTSRNAFAKPSPHVKRIVATFVAEHQKKYCVRLADRKRDFFETCYRCLLPERSSHFIERKIDKIEKRQSLLSALFAPITNLFD